jgi:hypothetical protein
MALLHVLLVGWLSAPVIATVGGCDRSEADCAVARSGQAQVGALSRAERMEWVVAAMQADLAAGLQQCEALDGRQRLACEARAVATARAPQGRLGRAQPASEEAGDDPLRPA